MVEFGLRDTQSTQTIIKVATRTARNVAQVNKNQLRPCLKAAASRHTTIPILRESLGHPPSKLFSKPLELS